MIYKKCYQHSHQIHLAGQHDQQNSQLVRGNTPDNISPKWYMVHIILNKSVLSTCMHHGTCSPTGTIMTYHNLQAMIKLRQMLMNLNFAKVIAKIKVVYFYGQ